MFLLCFFPKQSFLYFFGSSDKSYLNFEANKKQINLKQFQHQSCHYKTILIKQLFTTKLGPPIQTPNKNATFCPRQGQGRSRRRLLATKRGSYQWKGVKNIHFCCLCKTTQEKPSQKGCLRNGETAWPGELNDTVSRPALE